MNKKFNLLKFDPKTHIYTYKNKQAISASGVNYWSKVNFEILRRESRAMLNEAARRGTQLHTFIAHYLTNQAPDYGKFQKTDYFPLGEKFVAWWDQQRSRFDVVALEIPLVADISMAKVALCGTIDAILFDRQTKRYLIVDWKSTISFQKRNYYVLNYGIQLGIYRQLFVDNSEINYHEVDLGIICIHESGIKALKL